MTTYSPKLGDIVAIKSHPFSENNTDIVIAGDSQLISPLMVVIEILKDSKNQYDDKTGHDISVMGLALCKCLWFSHKTFLFEEIFLSSKHLKLIKSTDILKEEYLFTSESIPINNNVGSKFKSFFNVIFKTNSLETIKHKSSTIFSQYSNSEKAQEKRTGTSFLSFVSPVMEILQIFDAKETEKKEGFYNVRTGDKRKQISPFMIKCKWYNPIGDKFSEQIIPICALEKIEPVNENVLTQIKNLIKENHFILYTNEEGTKTFVKPSQIVYESGRYFLNGFDFLFNKFVSINMPHTPFEARTTYILDSYPKFDFITSEEYNEFSVTDELKEGILKASKSKSFIRIIYKNSIGNTSEFTLRNYSLHEVPSRIPKSKRTPVYYIKGFYLSDNKDRTFRMNRIMKLEVLNLKY